MNCTIYYGLSGTLKMCTINSLHKNAFKIYSGTKPFYELDEKYFNWSSRPNDCHLAMFRLMSLNLPGYLPNDGTELVIERGVSDNLFCVPNRKIPGLQSYDDMKIEELVNLESEYIIKNTGGYNITKKLLVMNDEDFIVNKALKDKYRSSLYPDLNTYFEKQNEYVNFTYKWNNIDEVTYINNAKNYIEGTLGLIYE